MSLDDLPSINSVGDITDKGQARKPTDPFGAALTRRTPITKMLLSLASLWFFFPSSLEGQSLPVWAQSSATASSPALKPRLESDSTSTTPSLPVEMTVADVVALALETSQEVKNQYLIRRIQKLHLEVAEDTFWPDLTVSPSIQRLGANHINADQTSSGKTNNQTQTFNWVSRLRWRILTGGTFHFEWIDNGHFQRHKPPDQAERNNNNFNQGFHLGFSQPLLRDAGVSVNEAPVEIARLSDDIQVLNLRERLLFTISDAIRFFRDLLQKRQQVEIDQRSLEQARQTLATNLERVEKGQMSRDDLIQTEVDIAKKEATLIASQSNVEASRYALLRILDVDKDFQVIPIAEPIPDPVSLDFEVLYPLAIRHRPDYLRTQKEVQIRRLQIDIAENQALWDLRLNMNYRKQYSNGVRETVPGNDFRHHDFNWDVGLSASYTFGDVGREQRRQQSHIDWTMTQNRLNDLENAIRIEIADIIRDATLRQREMELRRKVRELSERKLEIEMKKMEAGQSSSFQIVSFQNEVVVDRNEELKAVINYLNALTNLDRSLGMTLETWAVEVEAPH